MKCKAPEVQARGYLKTLKKQFHEEQIHRLPNEFRKAFVSYNHKMPWGSEDIDDNNYYFKWD